jgi:hypothetical protein
MRLTGNMRHPSSALAGSNVRASSDWLDRLVAICSEYSRHRSRKEARRLKGGTAARHKEKIMKSFVRRVSVAVASAAIVGGAVLGAGGSASAATSGPIEHDRSSIVHAGNGGGRDGHQADWYGHGRGYDRERDDGWDGYRGWYTYDGHGDDLRGWHQEGQYRWDGHRLYVRDDGR